MDSGRERARARADFYLSLARAFLAPNWEGAYGAMSDALPSDLEELGEVLGYDIAAPLQAYRRAMAALDELELLRCYSRLFLVPPAPVRINPCYYLDGELMGDTVTELVRWYRNAGLERAETFRDLPDHVSVQLEFAATLFSRAAEGAAPPPQADEFLGRFVARWLPPFLAALEREHRQDANPYLFLARILAQAVARDSSLAGRLLAAHAAGPIAEGEARDATPRPPADPRTVAPGAWPAEGDSEAV